MTKREQVIDVEKHIIKWRLWTSLLMIFAGAVIASKFNSWYAIGGGTALAVVGCYLNQLSIKWQMMGT
ncbi:hypothetical protein ES703_58713 [subsurface metagenome]